MIHNIKKTIRLLLPGMLLVGFVTYSALFITDHYSFLTKKYMTELDSLLNSIIYSFDMNLEESCLNITGDTLSALKKAGISHYTVSDRERIIVCEGTTGLEKANRHITITRKIERNHIMLGSITVDIVNDSAEKKAEVISDLIAKSNTKYLWDYNIDALNESASSFFNDPEIALIKIVDSTGLIIVNLEREKNSAKTVFSRNTLSFRGKEIGELIVGIIEESARSEIPLPFPLKITLIALINLALLLWFLIALSRVMNFRRAGNSHDGSFNGIKMTADMESRIIRGKEYIDNNFRRNISREGLASMLGMNPDSFGRYFKIYTGKRINEYINTLRIEEAVSMLQTSDANVLNIALAVGFENTASFYRTFMKIMKNTPSFYRNNPRSCRENMPKS